MTNSLTKIKMKNDKKYNKDGQDRRALLKAKYCPRVAAVSCTQKPCDLDL